VIAAQALVGVVAGVLVAGLVTVLIVLVGQSRQVNSQLEALAAAPRTTAVPAGTFVVTIAGDGQRTASPGAPGTLPREDQQRAARESRDDLVTETQVGDDEYRTLTRVVDGAVVQAGVALEPYESERHRLIMALALAGLGAAAVAALLGARLGSRAVAVWDEAIARQRTFIADASHELRTPLARLALRADILQRALAAGATPESVSADVALLREESAGLADIVDDLLQTADLEGAPEAGELVDLVDVVDHVLRHNAVLAAERGVVLTGAVDDVPPVRGAPTALRRAVDALLDNALHHASHRVVVRLRVAGEPVAGEPVAGAPVEGAAKNGAPVDGAPVEGDWVEVSVDVDGPGLSAHDAERIFARFARGAGSPRGYGFGRALFRDCVARHGGTVETVPLHPGTRFRVRLPVEHVERVDDDDASTTDRG
jgi:signal transduction histidine kinase